LIVYVEDEFTYYAVGKPRVANATVKIQNAQTGASFTVITGESGIAEFYDISEGNYILTVQKLGNGNHRSTVILDGTETNITVFIPKQVVSYTWTVISSLFTDQFEFVMTPIFETAVIVCKLLPD
jgi:hypothetical protein